MPDPPKKLRDITIGGFALGSPTLLTLPEEEPVEGYITLDDKDGTSALVSIKHGQRLATNAELMAANKPITNPRPKVWCKTSLFSIFDDFEQGKVIVNRETFAALSQLPNRDDWQYDWIKDWFVEDSPYQSEKPCPNKFSTEGEASYSNYLEVKSKQLLVPLTQLVSLGDTQSELRDALLTASGDDQRIRAKITVKEAVVARDTCQVSSAEKKVETRIYGVGFSAQKQAQSKVIAISSFVR